jgi:hypothetical protein
MSGKQKKKGKGRKGVVASLPLSEKIALVNKYNAAFQDGDLVAQQDLEEWAQAHNIKWSTFRRKLRSFREVYEELVVGLGVIQRIPEPVTRPFLDFPVIKLDDAVIIADVEIPDQSALMLRLATATGMAKGIRTLIIVGDLVATDQPTLNGWASLWRTGTEPTYKAMLGTLMETMRVLTDWFDKIYIVEGNHDYRIARATGGEIDLGMFFKADGRTDYIPGVEYSRYNYLYIQTSKRGIIKAIHQKNFSQNPLTMVKDFHAAEVGPYFDPVNPMGTVQKTGWIIAHCHIAQQGTTPDGVYQAVSLGTMRSKAHTKYVMQMQTRHRNWDSAFAVLQDGFLTSWNLATTNWAAELGALLPTVDMDAFQRNAIAN